MDPQTPSTPQGANSDITLPSQPIAGKTPKYRNILCIEDEHFISELYAHALDKAGYRVKVVVDGREGLNEARSNQYDIILLDIMLPGITGIEILKQLRDPSLKLKAKIIITTNLEQRDEAKAEIEKQADGYIIKAEITPKQLVDFLQSLEQ